MPPEGRSAADGGGLAPRLLRASGVLLTGALGLAACASPSASHTTTTTRPAPPRATTTTTTVAPSTTTTTGPTVTAVPGSVTVQVNGASATIAFSSASLTGTVGTADGAFGQGGTVYTFTVTGVTYSGAPSTTAGNGGLIASVSVGPGQGGALVTVKLSSPASHASFGEGHDVVGVQFS
ncbi:MAG TPA: hypothetical protein VKX24_01000 [Acidimicrobiia bacterium]|nr:hypothetical protein [Acidimicrobiia bacterium]